MVVNAESILMAVKVSSDIVVFKQKVHMTTSNSDLQLWMCYRQLPHHHHLQQWLHLFWEHLVYHWVCMPGPWARTL